MVFFYLHVFLKERQKRAIHIVSLKQAYEEWKIGTGYVSIGKEVQFEAIDSKNVISVTQIVFFSPKTVVYQLGASEDHQNARAGAPTPIGSGSQSVYQTGRTNFSFRKLLPTSKTHSTRLVLSLLHNKVHVLMFFDSITLYDIDINMSPPSR